MGTGVLDQEEGRSRECGHEQAGQYGRAGPPVAGCLNEAVGQSGQEQHRQAGPDRVDVARRGGIARFGHVARRDHEHGAATGRLMKNTHRHDPAMIRYPPSRGPAAVATPPSPDQAPMARAAILRSERGLEDGQAGRGHEGAPDALENPGQDEHAGIRGDPAAHGGDGEPDDADGEDALAPHAVAERAAQEEERRQGQRVARDDPLQGAHAAVKGAPDGGERDADDRGIDGGDARTEHGGRDHPSSAARAERELSVAVRLPLRLGTGPRTLHAHLRGESGTARATPTG